MFSAAAYAALTRANVWRATSVSATVMQMAWQNMRSFDVTKSYPSASGEKRAGVCECSVATPVAQPQGSGPAAGGECHCSATVANASH